MRGPPGTLAQTGPDDDEGALWQARAEGGRGSAREQLFSRYLPVARRLAWRFKRDEAHASFEFSEIMQLASVGLLEAIDRYRPELGVPFRYYCTRRIRGAIVDGVARLSEVSQQIATRRRIERERVRSLRGEPAEPQSLDDKLALIGDIAADLALGLMLEASGLMPTDERDPAPSAYETLAWKQAVEQIAGALDSLPERERTVVRHHYLEGVPFDQIAQAMGLSKGRVSQIHKGALALLRKRLSDMGRFRLEV